MSQSLIEGQKLETSEVAQVFVKMAEMITANSESMFGGACVVVPPATGGEPIVTLVLDSKQDPAQFWSLLETKCKMALLQLQELERQQGFRR